jgi:hypothetical protein
VVLGLARPLHSQGVVATQATDRSSRTVTTEELAKLNQELLSATWESQGWSSREHEGDSASVAALLAAGRRAE